MKDHTTNPVVRKTPVDVLIRWLSAFGNKIFEADDRRARDRDWEITPSHGGLSRSYRDPRFNYLRRCRACNGFGCSPDGVTCASCHGAGRVILDAAKAPQRPGRWP
jgi:hypothetical protein